MTKHELAQVTIFQQADYVITNVKCSVSNSFLIMISTLPYFARHSDRYINAHFIGVYHTQFVMA